MKKYLSLLLAILLLASALFTVSCKSDATDDTSKTESETEAKTEGETEDPTEKGYEGRSDFIDQLGGVSETYKGSVSKETYASAKDAAEAYVLQEVIGKAEATQVSTVSKGELSDKEVADLKIPAEFAQGIVAVEQLEVSYAVATANQSASTPQLEQLDNKTNKVTVYVIKYENNFKYFSPAPVRGDTITKSYYDSVFNADKYKNCTMTSEIELVIDMKEVYQGQPESAYMHMKTKRTVKYDGGKIFVVETTQMSMEGETLSQTSSLYLEEVDGQTVCYFKQDEASAWQQADLQTLGFASLEELTPFYDQYLDYTYFTKTTYGFALEKENAEQFLRESLANNPSAGAVLNYKDMEIDMFAEYYVADGVLTGMRQDSDVNVNVSSEDLSIMMDMRVDIITTCTDYGTTTVEKVTVN